MVHSHEDPTFDGSAAYAAWIEAEFAEQGGIGVPIAARTRSAAVGYGRCYLAGFVHSQEVGDTIIERVAVFVIVLQFAGKVALVHFTQKRRDFQLPANLFQIQGPRILIDTDVSPGRIKLFVGFDT